MSLDPALGSRGSKGSGRRILQLVTSRQLRGAEVFAALLSEQLAVGGDHVDYVGLYPPGVPPLAPANVACADLDTVRRRGVSIGLIRRLARLIDERDPDLIQANGSDTLKYAVLAGAIRARRRPLIYRNISVASHWARGALHRRWQSWLLRQVDAVVSVTAFSKQDLVEHFGVPEGKVSVIPRAVRVPDRLDRLDRPDCLDGPGGPELRTRLAAATGADASAPMIVHVGSFTPEKNHQGLLRAFVQVQNAVPRAQLILLGDGPAREAIRDRVRELNLARSVFVCGPHPEASTLMGGADVLVLFSDVEGMPGVVLEAGAMARPVVVTRVGGVSEVVEHGVSGWLVEPRDEAAFAESLVGLLENPLLGQRMGQELRRRVETEYALPAVVARYQEVYARLLARG